MTAQVTIHKTNTRLEHASKKRLIEIPVVLSDRLEQVRKSTEGIDRRVEQPWPENR